jgi:predicted nucleic acid-binding Zn ribbon protein
MPFGYVWTCDQCNHSIITAGLFTFRIDKNGNRIRCGHPVYSEADRKAVKVGASRDAYCPKCGEIKDVVVYIFADRKKKFPAICEICHTKVKENLENVPCPKCKDGHFRETGRWMS